MRRQFFAWTWLVLSLVLTIYGAYSLIYNSVHGKEAPLLAVIFVIAGGILLVLFLILNIVSYFQNKKKVVTSNDVKVEEKVEEAVQEVTTEDKPVSEKKPETPRNSSRGEVTYTRSRSSTRDFDGGSGYVKLVGYGPVLRVNDAEILDMRSNTYYRIEGNLVKQSGCGPVYEISGNKIKLAFGGYLYEISGGNVNKIYGGFYASMSGGYLQTHDLKEKYEIPTDLNLKQKLAIVALLFGTY